MTNKFKKGDIIKLKPEVLEMPDCNDWASIWKQLGLLEVFESFEKDYMNEGYIVQIKLTDEQKQFLMNRHAVDSFEIIERGYRSIHETFVMFHSRPTVKYEKFYDEQI
jgi:hypothetical protein